MATYAKSKRLEAALELGRNWALATTVAIASLSLLAIKGIYKSARYSQQVAAVGVILSLGWYVLSALRAIQVGELTTKNWRQRMALSLFILILYAAGLGIRFLSGTQLRISATSRSVRHMHRASTAPSTTTLFVRGCTS